MSWTMPLGTGDKFAIVHATCEVVDSVTVHSVRVLTGTAEDAKGAAVELAETFGIDPEALSIVPAGELTQSKRAGRPPSK